MSWAEAGEAQLREPFFFVFNLFQEISDLIKFIENQEKNSEKYQTIALLSTRSRK
jgi:hypothetical protein